MFTQLAVLVGVGAAFNVTAQVRKDGDPFATLLGAGALLGALAILGQLVDYRVSNVLGGLYAFGSFMINGEPLIDAATKFVTAPKTGADTAPANPFRATPGGSGKSGLNGQGSAGGGAAGGGAAGGGGW